MSLIKQDKDTAKAEKLEEAVALLREQIQRGDYGVRGYLPSRSALEREFGISHSVMNQVILQLEGEGLIASGNGSSKRLTVTPPRNRVPLRDVPFVRFLREQGLEPVTEYLEQPERKPMPDALAKEFGVPEGTLYVARVRRDGTKRIHYRLTSKYYLASLIDDETLAGMQANDKYDAVLDIKNKHGIVATFMTEDIIARLPTAQEQGLLGVVRTAPVMEVKRTCCHQTPWLKPGACICERVGWFPFNRCSTRHDRTGDRCIQPMHSHDGDAPHGKETTGCASSQAVGLCTDPCMLLSLMIERVGKYSG